MLLFQKEKNDLNKAKIVGKIQNPSVPCLVSWAHDEVGRAPKAWLDPLF